MVGPNVFTSSVLACQVDSLSNEAACFNRPKFSFKDQCIFFTLKTTCNLSNFNIPRSTVMLAKMYMCK